MDEARNAHEAGLPVVSERARTATPLTKPTTAKFLTNQSMDSHFRQSAFAVGTSGSNYSENYNGFLIHVALIDGAV